MCELYLYVFTLQCKLKYRVQSEFIQAATRSEYLMHSSPIFFVHNTKSMVPTDTQIYTISLDFPTDSISFSDLILLVTSASGMISKNHTAAIAPRYPDQYVANVENWPFK